MYRLLWTSNSPLEAALHLTCNFGSFNCWDFASKLCDLHFNDFSQPFKYRTESIKKLLSHILANLSIQRQPQALSLRLGVFVKKWDLGERSYSGSMSGFLALVVPHSIVLRNTVIPQGRSSQTWLGFPVESDLNVQVLFKNTEQILQENSAFFWIQSNNSHRHWTIDK